jgi:hypothetical protein
MTGRHWFRKDVLLPIIYVLGLGLVLRWLWQLLPKASPDIANSSIVQITLWGILVIYALLALITFRHVLSTYDLERYDPGEPASLKRLMRRYRYQLHRRSYPDEALMMAIEQTLLDDRYHLESESHLIGRVYCRQRKTGLLLKWRYDRVILLQHEPLNVLLVDQLLQDCIRHIRSLTEKPSNRNILILVTRMEDPGDVASVGAGIANFLGKFKGGTLCPLLLSTRHNRLFFPSDRTLMPRSHRWFQNRLRHRLKSALSRIPAELKSDIQ